MAAILTNGVLKIRTAPIFQPLLAPARYKGSGSAKARCTPPMPRTVRPGGRQHRLELRHAASDGQAHTTADPPASPATATPAASRSLKSGTRERGGNRVNNRPRELIHPSASPGAALPALLPSLPQPQPAADHPCWVSLQQVSL